MLAVILDFKIYEFEDDSNFKLIIGLDHWSYVIIAPLIIGAIITYGLYVRLALTQY